MTGAEFKFKNSLKTLQSDWLILKLTNHMQDFNRIFEFTYGVPVFKP